MTQVELIVNDMVSHEFLEKALLMAPIGLDHINVIFTRVTDMTHIDACFRDRRRPMFEEYMQDENACSGTVDGSNV